MDKKATKTVTQAMQERNEQRATEMMTKAAKMIRNAQDLISTLERLVSEDRKNTQPCTAKELVKVDMPIPETTSVPELQVVKDARLSNNKTGYEGVFFDNTWHSYVAEVSVRGRRRRKYGFKTPEEAKVVREQMKCALLKEIEGELRVDVPAHKGNVFRYDMETLRHLGSEAWIAWAKEAVNRVGISQNGGDVLLKLVRKTEDQTRSRVKTRLNWAKYHAYFAGKAMDEANQLNVYDVLANDRVLRDAFTEIVVQALSGVAETGLTTETGLATETSTVKRKTKRAGVKLKEFATGNTATEEKVKAVVELG